MSTIILLLRIVRFIMISPLITKPNHISVSFKVKNNLDLLLYLIHSIKMLELLL